LKLSSFRYLSRNRLLVLMLVVAVASALFSIAALSLLSFYNGFTAYLGEDKDVLAIYDRASSTPFTSLIPAYLVEELSSLDGVSACSPEVLAPCIINGRASFIRGILPEQFMKINAIKVLEGEMLKSSDADSAIIGFKAAERLGLKVNSRIIVYGVVADRYLELTIKGVYRSGSLMDDEVLVPLHVGQWLRGSGYDYVTLIRVKAEKASVLIQSFHVEVGEALKESQASAGGSSPSPLYGVITPRAITHFNPDKIGVEEASRLMKTYMDKYGLSREIMLIFSAVAFLFSSLTVAAAIRTIIVQHRGEISILRSIGASGRTLKLDLLIKLLPLAIFASLMGVASAALAMLALQEGIGLELMSHTLTLQFDPIILILPPAFSIILISTFIIRAKLEA